jgi:hypothetical protein
VQQDGGPELEAVIAGIQVPQVGERVAVEVEPGGVVETRVWRPDMQRRG